MSSKRATLIHNPESGDDRQPSAGQLQLLLETAGYKVRYASTKENGWKKALKRSADLVAVAGGDGTVAKVARRLIERGVPIGVLPLGTANNISKTLGISGLEIETLIDSWKDGWEMSFDAGIARGPWGERYFIEGAGAGLLANAIPKIDASTMHAQLQQSEVKLWHARQLIQGHLSATKSLEIMAKIDGEDVSGRYLLIEVMNMQFIGPNLFLAPAVTHKRGEFEVALVSEEHAGAIREHIQRWQERNELPPEFKIYSGKKVDIEWTGFRVHIDDKLWPAPGKKKPRSPARLEFEAMPNALRFLIPRKAHH
jgi:diacylglycerol kinase family enzyme